MFSADSEIHKMIPAYLLMRDLDLLNTFFALVLPGTANGMPIFILLPEDYPARYHPAVDEMTARLFHPAQNRFF